MQKKTNWPWNEIEDAGLLHGNSLSRKQGSIQAKKVLFRKLAAKSPANQVAL